MRSHVAKLLKGPIRQRKTMSISLDPEQAELVEKLSLFFSRETQHSFSKNQVIEEAVKAFVDDSAEYIAQEYSLDIRGVALSELQRYKRAHTLNVAALDTVVLPVRDDEENRHFVFQERTCKPVHLHGERLQGIKYAAFCFGSPTSAITHYAKIRAAVPAPDYPRRYVLLFEAPEELGEPLEWHTPGARLRRPRYTVLSMLLEAKSIEELFQ